MQRLRECDMGAREDLACGTQPLQPHVCQLSPLTARFGVDQLVDYLEKKCSVRFCTNSRRPSAPPSLKDDDRPLTNYSEL